MTIQSATRPFAVGDRVTYRPPYGTGMVGIVDRVRRFPATKRQVCHVNWYDAAASWELADDLIPCT